MTNTHHQVRTNVATLRKSNSSKADEHKQSKGSRKGGRLEVLRIPKPKSRYNTQAKLKQTRLKKSEKPQKLAAISLPDKDVPFLSRILEWAKYTIDHHHVGDILANYPTIMDDDFMSVRVAQSHRKYVWTDDYDFNFVIPDQLGIKLKAIIEAKESKRPKSNYFNPITVVGGNH